VTALRWAAILRDLGHRVLLEEEWKGRRCDALVALHARRSYPSIARFHEAHPELPLILALTGTDLYGDIHTDPDAQRSLELADRIILLQPAGLTELPEYLRPKARVIFQSVPLGGSKGEMGTTGEEETNHPDTVSLSPPVSISPLLTHRQFDVCVMGHLRPVKDPFRTALAARLLPASSRVRVLHLGAALSEEMAVQAREEEAANPRYRWLGELPRWKAMRVLARCQLLALTSELEGGANVISEALAVGVPIVSSRISGSIGLLGEEYPGYFPVGDTQALADLLGRAETELEFYRSLVTACAARRPLIEPARERRSWECLLEEFGLRNGRESWL
jgi:glycosyltransferase involved in cell wall biosynthesis